MTGGRALTLPGGCTTAERMARNARKYSVRVRANCDVNPVFVDRRSDGQPMAVVEPLVAGSALRHHEGQCCNRFTSRILAKPKQAGNGRSRVSDETDQGTGRSTEVRD